MFFTKKSYAPPSYDHLSAFRHYLAMREWRIAVATASTSMRYGFDEDSDNCRVALDTGIGGSAGHLVGIVHSDRLQDTVVRASVFFYGRKPSTEGRIGEISISRHKQEWDGAIFQGNQQLRDSMAILDSQFYVSASIADSSEQVFSQIQQAHRDAASSGLRFSHVSLRIPKVDDETILKTLSSGGSAKIPIASIGWASEVTLPNAPPWSHIWWET